MKYTDMKIKKEYAIKLNKGDNIKIKLQEFMDKEQITFAKISGIGAVNNLQLGLYQEGIYVRKWFEGNWDVISMDGNMSLKDGKPMFHIHMCCGSMAKENYAHTISGHFMDADIIVVGEIFVTSYDKVVEREFDEPSKMMLWNI